MKTSIINQLIRIRFLERRKLCEKFDIIIRNNKNKDDISMSFDMFEQFLKSFKDDDSERNLSIALANYNKLRDILLYTINIRKKIKFDLLSHSKDPSRIEVFLEKVNKELLDLILKINASVPEQLNVKPLDPYFFIQDDIKIIRGKICIIVLCNNSEDYLPDLFNSFLKYNTYENYKFVIVDRNSSDNSIEIIKSYEDKLKIKLLPHDELLTSSYLNNLAVDNSQSEYLLFLHAKSSFKADALPALRNFLDNNENYGIIGATVHLKGSAQQAHNQNHYGGLKFKFEEIEGLPDIPNPIFDPDFLAESGIQLSLRAFRQNERTFIPPGHSMPCLKPLPAIYETGSGLEEVPAVPGFAMFCKRDDFISAGGFDLNYLNGFEYTDLCLQFARKINKKTAISHSTEIELNAPDVITEWCIPDPVIDFHNLGVLIDQHGYFIKNHYLNSIAEGSHKWTDDKEMIPAFINITNNNKFRIVIKIPAYNNENASLWGDFHFAHSLKNSFIRKGHFARVDLYDQWYENGYLNDDVVIVLRGIKSYHVRKSQINIMWNISHPEHVTTDEYEDYDHVFVASEIFSGELLEKYKIKAERLMQCTDPELFNIEEKPGERLEPTDILYVANSRGVMRKSVEYAMKKNILFTIYGTNWENLLPAGMVKGNFIPNEELKNYYSGCKILLNDHWKDMADEGYISNRIFDALACGAVILTDKVKGIEEVFPEGLFYYDTPDEMEEQIAWIRANYEEAKALALKNSREVLEKHTFDQRAERILEVIMQIHERKISFIPPETAKK